MISLKSAADALRAFVQARNGNTVDAPTLKRRMDICSAPCPKRQLIKSTPRDAASRILAMMANSNRVPDDIKRYKCGVCSCPLMLLGPALPEHLHQDSPEEAKERARYAPNCWLPKAVAGEEASGE